MPRLCVCQMAVAAVLCLAPPVLGGESILTPENEEGAFRELPGLLEGHHANAAYWIASIYRDMADKGAQLEHAAEWRAVASELYDANQYRREKDEHYFLYRARAAAAVGANKVAIKSYVAALGKTDDNSDKARYARYAAVCAMRMDDYERAIELFGLTEKHGMTWAKELGKKRADQLREYIKTKNTAESRIKLAREFWIGDSPGEGLYYKDAIAAVKPLLAPPWQLDDTTRQEVMQLIEHWLSKSDDPAALKAWRAKTMSAADTSPEKKAEVLFRTGVGLHKAGKLDEALKHFRQTAEHPKVRSWPEAVFNSGYVLMQQKRWKEAIAEFDRLLKATVNNKAEGDNIMSPYRNYQHRACNRTSLCYESLRDFKNALKYTRLANSTYRFESWCGTCARSDADSAMQRLAMLEALTKLESMDPPVIAAAAGKFLGAGNEHAKRVVVQLGAAAVPEIVKTLRSEKRDTRLMAVDALGKIGPEAADAIPRLIELLKDKDDAVAGEAARVLRRMGPKGRLAIPALIRTLGDERGAWANAKQSIRELGINPDQLPLLLDAVASENHQEARAAADLMDDVDGLGAESVPLLFEFAHKNPGRADRVHGALVKIGEPAVMPMANALRKYVRLPDEERKRDPYLFLCNGLRLLAPHATNHIDEIAAMLVEMQGHPTTGFRETLASMGEPAVPKLVELLGSPKAGLRNEAARALRYMGSRGRSATPKLVECARAAKNEYERRLMHDALLAMGARSRAAVKLFVEGVGDRDALVARDCARALGNLGHVVPAARPGLQKLTGHSHWETKRAAEATLHRMSVLARIGK